MILKALETKSLVPIKVVWMRLVIKASCERWLAEALGMTFSSLMTRCTLSTEAATRSATTLSSALGTSPNKRTWRP